MSRQNEPAMTDDRVNVLEPGDLAYPARLAALPGLPAPGRLWALGNLDLLELPWLAVFGSLRCPGSLILQAYDLSLALQAAGVPLAGGFHSPVEKDVLRVALRGNQPLLICLARGLEGIRLPSEYRPALESGLLLLVSPFAEKVRRPTAETAAQRNRLAAALAERVLVLHAEPGGKLDALREEARGWGKEVVGMEEMSDILCAYQGNGIAQTGPDILHL